MSAPKASIPDEIVKLYESLLGEELGELLACLERYPEVFIRINTLKKSKLEVIRRLQQKGMKLSPLSWFRCRL